jgi:hypothetical protein
VAELPAWPTLFTPPAELLGWLEEQRRLHQRDPAMRRHLLTLRWLVLAELDRTAPAFTSKPDFSILN